MRTLERQLGGQLLIRDHAGARPTALGRKLLDDARLMVDRHDRLVAAITSPVTTPTGPLRVGVPLELPAGLLPAAIARVTAAHPDVHVHLQHSSSTAQLAALRAGELEVALVRDRPSDPGLDSVLAVEEAMGVILTTARSDEISDPDGVPLHRLTGMTWAKFARADAPAWHDQVLATLRTHGVDGTGPGDQEDERPVPPEVKLAAGRYRARIRLRSPRLGTPAPRGPGLASPDRQPNRPPHLGSMAGRLPAARDRHPHRRPGHNTLTSTAPGPPAEPYARHQQVRSAPRASAADKDIVLTKVFAVGGALLRRPIGSSDGLPRGPWSVLLQSLRWIPTNMHTLTSGHTVKRAGRLAWCR